MSFLFLIQQGECTISAKRLLHTHLAFRVGASPLWGGSPLCSFIFFFPTSIAVTLLAPCFSAAESRFSALVMPPARVCTPFVRSLPPSWNQKWMERGG
jgi:hypothetical protein